MAVSENVVYPIVANGFADHYPYEKWLAIIGKINPTFSGPNPYPQIIIPAPLGGPAAAIFSFTATSSKLSTHWAKAPFSGRFHTSFGRHGNLAWQRL